METGSCAGKGDGLFLVRVWGAKDGHKIEKFIIFSLLLVEDGKSRGEEEKHEHYPKSDIGSCWKAG